MPQRKNLTWGEIPKQRVRRFLEVLLDAEDNDRKLLKLEWQEGQRDRYCLFVHYTTKANLVKLITGKPYPTEKKKAEIQDAIAHLEELQILTDLRPVKTGAKAKNLSFSLDLPVQEKSAAIQFILETKWVEKSNQPKNSKPPKSEPITGTSDLAKPSTSPDCEIIAEIEQQGDRNIVRWQIKMGVNLENLDSESITKIQTVVRQIAGDNYQTIMDIREGSIIVEFAGSEAGFKKILDLFKRGELTEIAGFSVEAVEAVEAIAQVDDPVNLSQWQQDIFPAAWQAIASLLSSSQMQLAFGWRSDWEPEIIRGHKINLGANLAATSLVLVVGLATENEAKTRICLQLHPTPQQNHLPPNLQLILIDEKENPVLATQTENSTSRFLQLDFRGDIAEPFAVKISLENDIIIKNFVI